MLPHCRILNFFQQRKLCYKHTQCGSLKNMSFCAFILLIKPPMAHLEQCSQFSLPSLWTQLSLIRQAHLICLKFCFITASRVRVHLTYDVSCFRKVFSFKNVLILLFQLHNLNTFKCVVLIYRGILAGSIVFFNIKYYHLVVFEINISLRNLMKPHWMIV